MTESHPPLFDGNESDARGAEPEGRRIVREDIAFVVHRGDGWLTAVRVRVDERYGDLPDEDLAEFAEEVLNGVGFSRISDYAEEVEVLPGSISTDQLLDTAWDADNTELEPPEDVPGLENFPAEEHPSYPLKCDWYGQRFFEHLYYGFIEECWVLYQSPSSIFQDGPDAASARLDTWFDEVADRVTSRTMQYVTDSVRTAWSLKLENHLVPSDGEGESDQVTLTGVANSALSMYGHWLVSSECREFFNRLVTTWGSDG